MSEPKLISIDHHSTPANGNLGVLDFFQNNLPFKVKRIFWIKSNDEPIERGNHAHKASEHFVIAIYGSVKIQIESISGEVFQFELNSDSHGLYIPPNYWRTLEFDKSTIQLVLSSTNYNSSDYLNSKRDFINYWQLEKGGQSHDR